MTLGPQSSKVILLLGVALVLATLPAAFAGDVQVGVETAPPMQPSSEEQGSCCPHDRHGTEPSTDSPSSDTPLPHHDTCCPVGCSDCFLPCCSGSASLNAASPPPVGPELGLPSILFHDLTTFCSIDPRAIDHPPRI